MIDVKEIFEALHRRHASGETPAEIGRAAKMAPESIEKLLSGEMKVENLTLKALNLLFPNAVIHLNGGDSSHIHAPGNRGNIAGNNHGAVGCDCLAVMLQKVLEAEELSDEEKVKVMKVLRK